MKAQTPAQGISIDHDWGDAKVFNIECDCSDSDHAVKMWIEVQRDRDVPDVEIGFYVTTRTAKFWQGWPQRLRAVKDILMHGIYQQEHHMLLNRQAALNFASAIQNTVADLDEKL